MLECYSSYCFSYDACLMYTFLGRHPRKVQKKQKAKKNRLRIPFNFANTSDVYNFKWNVRELILSSDKRTYELNVECDVIGSALSQNSSFL